VTALVYLPSADADLLEIYLTIASDDVGAADRFIGRIRRSVLRLADFPLSAPARPELGKDIRCLTIGAYRVLHRVEADDVLIVRVILAARDFDPLFTHG